MFFEKNSTRFFRIYIWFNLIFIVYLLLKIILKPRNILFTFLKILIFGIYNIILLSPVYIHNNIFASLSHFIFSLSSLIFFTITYFYIKEPQKRNYKNYVLFYIVASLSEEFDRLMFQYNDITKTNLNISMLNLIFIIILFTFDIQTIRNESILFEIFSINNIFINIYINIQKISFLSIFIHVAFSTILMLTYNLRVSLNHEENGDEIKLNYRSIILLTLISFKFY